MERTDAPACPSQWKRRQSLHFLASGCASALAGPPLVSFATSHAHAATAAQILTQRPFAIRLDCARFYLQHYDPAAAGPDIPSGDRERPEGEIVAFLETYVQRQFPGNTAAQADAMRFYNSDVARRDVPSPTLRAAVTGLKGTFAEPAISFLLSDRVSKIVFDDRQEDPELKAAPRTWAHTWQYDNGHLAYFFRAENKATYPFIFTAIFAHEALHEDRQLTGTEEVIAKAVENWMIIQIASRHPEIMQSDNLSRRLNSGAMILYNSGLGAQVGGLYQTNRGALIPPNSPHYCRSWWDNAITKSTFKDWGTTPGNDLLRQYMLNLGIPVRGTPDFSKETLALFDRARPRGMTDQDLVIAGRNLGLAVPAG